MIKITDLTKQLRKAKNEFQNRFNQNGNKIKLTPNAMVTWVANIVLKGIAELTDFSFDIDERKAYVQIQLAGESETIEVWLEGFAVVGEEESYKFIVHQAQSNRLWLDNLLERE